MKEKITQFGRTFGVLVLLFGIFAGIAYAANFTQPGGSPTSFDVAKLLNIGTENQVKEGNLGAKRLIGTDRLTGENQVCIGNDCRSVWPGTPSNNFSTTCKINTLVVGAADDRPGIAHQNSGSVVGSELATKCNAQLTQAEKSAGWMLASFDNCPGTSGRDCSGGSYCTFMQFQCADGITFVPGTFEQTHYVYLYQCEDGIDNDNDGFIDNDDYDCDLPNDDTEAYNPKEALL